LRRSLVIRPVAAPVLVGNLKGAVELRSFVIEDNGYNLFKSGNPHLRQVRGSSLFSEIAGERADLQRDALGFLPRSAYREAAAQGKLYVATVGDGRSERYAGHLLFGGKFPHLKIFQVYVEPALRGRHIGRSLVEKLAVYAEQQSYLTISARVATDLAANTFWESLHFVAVRIEEGGLTTGRRINIRVRELETPTLFTGANDSTSTALLLPKPEQPVYVLDVNVFLDIVKDRQRPGARAPANWRRRSYRRVCRGPETRRRQGASVAGTTRRSEAGRTPFGNCVS